MQSVNILIISRMLHCRLYIATYRVLQVHGCVCSEHGQWYHQTRRMYSSSEWVLQKLFRFVCAWQHAYLSWKASTLRRGVAVHPFFYQVAYLHQWCPGVQRGERNNGILHKRYHETPRPETHRAHCSSREKVCTWKKRAVRIKDTEDHKWNMPFGRFVVYSW